MALSEQQLINAVRADIRANDQELITGNLLQSVLVQMIQTMFPKTPTPETPETPPLVSGIGIWSPSAIVTVDSHWVHDDLFYIALLPSGGDLLIVEPGTSPTHYRNYDPSTLTHPQNTDFMLGRYVIGVTGTVIDLRTGARRNKNEFILSAPDEATEHSVNFVTVASAGVTGVNHVFSVRLATWQNTNIRFTNTADMFVGDEDLVLRPGHIAYFLGSAISPGGTMRTHLLFTTDQSRITNLSEALETLTTNLGEMAYVDDAPAGTITHGRRNGQWVEVVAGATYDDTLIWAAVNARTPQLMAFGRVITTATTLAGTDLYREIVVNSPTNTNLTIGVNIPIGGWINFRIDGAGLPVFVIGANQSINIHSLALRQFCQLYRGENSGTTERYFVI